MELTIRDAEKSYMGKSDKALKDVGCLRSCCPCQRIISLPSFDEEKDVARKEGNVMKLETRVSVCCLFIDEQGQRRWTQKTQERAAYGGNI